jgi:hypothetical protein
MSGGERNMLVCILILFISLFLAPFFPLLLCYDAYPQRFF